MDNCKCTEQARLQRIETFLDGNGRAGLNDRVSGMDEKIDHLTGAVRGLKNLLKWSIGVLITVASLTISIIALFL